MARITPEGWKFRHYLAVASLLLFITTPAAGIAWQSWNAALFFFSTACLSFGVSALLTPPRRHKNDGTEPE